MPAVLFVCTQNRFRSPLAAAMFQKCLEKEGIAREWKVASAGTWTVSGTSAHPAALLEAHKLGLTLKDHHTRSVSKALLTWADLVVVMEAGQLEAIQTEFDQTRGHVFLLAEIVDEVPYDLPDFIDRNGEQSLNLGEEVCGMVERGYQRICNLAVQIQRSSQTTKYESVENKTVPESGKQTE
jgi:protein-tyrosine phosphatase